MKPNPWGDTPMKSKDLTRIYVAVLTIAALMAAGCGARTGPAAAPQSTGSQLEKPQPVTPTPDSTPVAEGAPATGGAAPASGTPASGAASKGIAGAPAAGGSALTQRPAAGVAAPKVSAGSASSPAPGRPTPDQAIPGSTGPVSGGQAGGAEPKELPGTSRIPGPSSQGVTDTEIKVGVLAPLSGYAAFLGQEQLDGVKAYLSEVNENGGVGGRKYRIVAADTRWEPAVEAAGARRLVEQEKVFALFITFGDAIASYVASKGIPTFAFGAIPHAFSSKFPNIYPVGFTIIAAIPQMAYTLTQVLKLPIKSVAILYETANLTWGSWVDYAKKAWEHYGVEVKSVDRFNLSDGDCTQLALKIQSLKVDFWQVAQSLGWPLCQQAMTRQNYTPPLGRGGPYTEDVLWGNQMGQGYDGIYAQTNGVQIGRNNGQPWPYDPSGKAPEVDHYVDSMKKFSPRSASPAILSGIWTQNFWAQGKLLNEAVRRQAGAVTWDGANQWIQSQKNWNSGLVSPGSFDPKCKTGASQMWIHQFKWNASANSVEPGDWQPHGGPIPVPQDLKNALVPGAGDCYITAMADSKL